MIKAELIAEKAVSCWVNEVEDSRSKFDSPIDGGPIEIPLRAGTFM